MLHHGDCLDVMAAMEPESVDAIVTDPPYGLEFMGKAWDKIDSRARFRTRVDGRTNPKVGKSTVTVPEAYVGGSRAQAWHEQWAQAAFRVAKPSAYLLAFGGTRTVHRMTVAIEDAGWIIRDMLVWAYASGFPKSKASLKPAWEPIVMARKPGPLRMLAIDECRIPFVGDETPDDREGEATAHTRYTLDGGTNMAAKPGRRVRVGGGAHAVSIYGSDGNYVPGPNAFVASEAGGRWPANVILTDPIFDGGWDGVVGGGEAGYSSGTSKGDPDGHGIYGAAFPRGDGRDVGYGDSGTYSRFFLIPKAARSDREPVLGGLVSGFAPTMGNGIGGREHDPANVKAYRANHHPTVKPVDLMRHLVRLVTPPGGTVLDPFLGSGTTALAAEMEGFAWIGIEKEAEYVAIAEARLNGTQRGLGLEAG